MGIIGNVKQLFTVKKFLFFLDLQTGGYFTNSYNLFLSVFLFLGSLCLPSIVLDNSNVITYVVSLFIYVGLAVTSLYALKGIESGDRFKISLGFVTTTVWLVIFISMFVLAFFWTEPSWDVRVGFTFFTLFLSLIHLYLLINMIFMYRFSG